jgi:HYDIN/CFA65/VesB family protein
MYCKALVSGGVALALAQALSCSLDTRSVTLPNLPGEDMGDASPASIGLGGNEPAAAPMLAVDPASIDFGTAVVGSASRARLTLGNTGDGPLAAPDVSMLAGADPDFAILLSECEDGIDPGERCDVRLQVLPSKPGPSSARVNVASTGQALQVPVTAVGLESGPLTLAPAAGSSKDFGGVVLGSSSDAQFDVSNPTADPSGPLSFAVNDAQFVLLAGAAGDCQPGSTTLADGQTCRLRVSFAPTRRGTADASLVVTSGNLRSTSLPVVGVGMAAGSLGAPEVVDFGAVTIGSSGQRTLQVENRGDAPLQLGSVALAGAASVAMESAVGASPSDGAASAFSVQNSDCSTGETLVGGARCTITAAFRPLVPAPGQSTQLLVTAADGTQHAIQLVGSGMPQGALTITPAAGGSSSFGDLTVGQSSTQTFVVANSTAQPSGPVELQTYDDFEIVESGASDACESGVTSLVNGQSCTVSVALRPASRGQHDGALTVTSSLAGVANLALTGHGLSRAQLSLASSELDFGRVQVSSTVQQSVTVVNTGDEPLAAVEASLEGATGGAALGFSLQNGCVGELAANASCSIIVGFSPPSVASYQGVLHLGGDEGVATSALLLGLAFPQGSLVLATADGSNDFGDVALGSPRTIAYTLTNPSTTASGRLTITTNNPRFVVDADACAAAASAGLVNGESCSFNVTFAPINSDAVTGSLSVQSPGAGETAVSISGRGRSAPHLGATGNRDFGVGIVDQQAINEAANQFTWALTNDGDLATGALQITNANPAEFVVSNDTCTGLSVPGHGSCAMDIRFAPSSATPHTANLVVTDPSTMQLLTLVMTGTGVIIAQPGESCANGATCATGQCTGGVCCDRACAGSCQVCSATGVCNDQSGREACGNGNGRCFGVDQCLLPEGQACSGGEQCGDGNCEPRLGGAGAGDRICCLADCDSTGLVCNPQTGMCQPPTLSAGAACGAAGQQACGAGLECKTCFGGGSQCTPPDVCCGGCDPASDYTCVNGECACPTGSNGQPQLDCGSGQCVLTQQFACCAVSPQCPADRRVCDGPAGVCRQCLQASDCPAPTQAGHIAACNNFTCSTPCNPVGFIDCGGGLCIPNREFACCPSSPTCTDPSRPNCDASDNLCKGCTSDAQCGQNRACQQNNCVCTGCTINGACVGAGSADPNNGCQSCNVAVRRDAYTPNNAACDDGQFCTVGDVCQGGRCTGGGTRDCGNGMTCVGNACQQVGGTVQEGGECNNANDCAGGLPCTQWFITFDTDPFGSEMSFRLCGTSQPPQQLSVGRYVSQGGDCCDVQFDGSSEIFPGAIFAPATVPELCDGVAINCGVQ